MPSSDSSPNVRVAVVQAAPIPFDLDATVGRVVKGIEESAELGAELILFPEAFVGGYPWGLAFGTAVGGRSPAGRRVFGRYRDAAIDVPGPETERIGAAAKAAGAYVTVGVIERDPGFGAGTLFCTLLYFGPDGALLGKHRKLKPTAV